MKVLKLLAAMAAFALVACGPDNTDNGGGDKTKEGFKVVASTNVIAADGVDAVQFTATNDGVALLASDLLATVNGATAEMPDLKFSTNVAGTYTIVFNYKEETSEEFLIEAVSTNGLDLSPIEESGLTMKATTTVFQKDVEEVLLIVRYKGSVVANPADITFYDFDTNEEIAMEEKEVTDINGDNYVLAKYAPKEIGTRSIWAAYKTSNTREKPVTLTAVDFAIPSRAIDPQPANTNFNKRVFITQFTGTECGYCPFFIAALHTLSEDAEHNDRYVLAAVHTYSTSDPMYPSDYSDIDRSFGVSAYPHIICDMREGGGNGGYQANLAWLKSRINSLGDEPAKAGISAKIDYADGFVVARATVKAAEAGNYRIGAWLVEDDIHAMQYNNGCKVEGVDFETHEAAVRIPDSKPEGSSHYAGHSLGTLAAGETVDYVFVMELKQSDKIDNPKQHWVAENCRMIFFVTTDSAAGTYVTNVVENDDLTQTITFDYK